MNNNTPAQVTEAHTQLRNKILETYLYPNRHDATQLIADSEARALTALTAERDQLRIENDSRVAWIAKMLPILGCENKDGFNCRDAHKVAEELISERDRLRTQLVSLTCIHHTDAERAGCPVCLVTQLRAEVERLRGYSDELDGVTNALNDALTRAVKAEAEPGKDLS
jgi:hypothetical protein